MALRITSEERQELKDEFINENISAIAKYESIILEYWKSKDLLSEQKIVNKIFQNADNVETIAGNILFTLATTEPGEKPLQSVAGSISGMISASDSFKDRTEAMHTAMELLMVSQPFTAFTYSKNGFPMIESMISDEDIITKNIILPLERPTEQHTTLGSYNWELTGETYAIDKLNHTPLRTRPLIEQPEIAPDPTDFSPSAIKQRELCNKQSARKYLGDQYAHKKIYFNWASDYRGRMYSTGYYLNPQGNEVEKSMIELYNGEALTSRGIEQLKKSIASAYGKDKSNDEDKLLWFSKNENMLHLRQNNAKEPFVFQSLVRAWKDHQSSLDVHTMISLDASCSQTQVMAVLLHSEEIAETCNVVNSYTDSEPEVIQDLYKLIADRMTEILEEHIKAA